MKGERRSRKSVSNLKNLCLALEYLNKTNNEKNVPWSGLKLAPCFHTNLWGHLSLGALLAPYHFPTWNHEFIKHGLVKQTNKTKHLNTLHLVLCSIQECVNQFCWINSKDREPCCTQHLNPLSGSTNWCFHFLCVKIFLFVCTSLILVPCPRALSSWNQVSRASLSMYPFTRLLRPPLV